MSHFAGKGTASGKKAICGRYPLEFKKTAVQRLKSCDNIVALAEELGVHRRMFYRWRDQFEARDDGEPPSENIKERDLRIQLATAKRLLAEKALSRDQSASLPRRPFVGRPAGKSTLSS